MKKSTAVKSAKFCILPLLLASCLTMSDYNFRKIDHAIDEGNYSEAYSAIDSDKSAIYSTFDKSLAALDSGLLSHYAKEYARSNKELSNAEELFKKNAAKSISQAVGSMLVNDTIIDYSGDPYEDIYTNVFMALNYLHLGKFDDAMVEIRRFDTKLKEISAKYQAEIEAEKMQLKSNSKSVPAVKMQFHNSALAHYLSMLLYRADGDMDNAAVDMRFIENAFKFQPALYDFPRPAGINQDLDIPKDMCRLNLIAFTGRSPEKKEIIEPLWAVDDFYRIALPVMEKRKSAVNVIEFYATDKSSGTTYFSKAEKLESIENIAEGTYSQKYSLIAAKTIARMAAKLTTSAALDAAAKTSDEDITSVVFSLLGFASKVSAFATERADVRTSRYFPASAFVSGINLKEGIYDVKIVFKSGNRIILSQTYTDIHVAKKGINLIEAFCLK